MKVFSTQVLRLIPIFIALTIFSCNHKKPEELQAGEVEIQIDHPSTGTVRLNTNVNKNETVLDAMNRLQKNKKLNFVSKDSKLGSFVHTIMGQKNSKGCPCWVYSVNGKLANKGVDSLKLGAGDKIRWCFLKYEEREKCAD